MSLSFSLDELTTPLTTAECKQAIYDAITAFGTNTTTWKPNAVTRAMIGGVAIVLAALSSLVAFLAGAGFLALATGQWLTLVALYVFGVERRAATFASGLLTLTNGGGGIYTDVEIGAFVAKHATTGKLYYNAEVFSLGLGGTVDVQMAAVEAGSASTAGVGTITEIESGGYTDVTVTNDATFVGLEEQSDIELRTACVSYRDAKSPNGAKRAYDWVALDAVRNDGTAIGINRTRALGDGNSGVTIYVATASGAVPGDEADELTDLGAVAQAIREEVESLTITTTTTSATNETIDVDYEIWVWSDVDVSAAPAGVTTKDRIKAQILLDLTQQLATIPIGGNDADTSNQVFADAIQTTIGSSFEEVYRTKLNTPATDTTLTVGQAPVVGIVTGVVNLVARQ